VYVPSKFSLQEEEAWEIVRDAGAGMLVVASPSGLESVFVPVIMADGRRTIRCHVARANPWWRLINNGMDVLGLFLSASAYVSPTNYPSTAMDPGVVPTWNYVSAEVRGRITVHDDPTWLNDQVRALTDHFEMDRSPAWRVDDAPPSYIDRQLKAIVGLEIDVVAVQGKAKLSQNRPAIDHDAVRDNFARGTLAERIVATRMNNE
jgi:transcriptional regulator